ncbi:sensor histidine kinase [Cupriavidus alkaliphilus]|uniref:sensor histidine kinase n=1 Tax=Cupriavidus alkaliphilus TaxID=942866 RepID=UPI002434FB9B|nr:sensor histidine kinase [Cupriavidus alkaliphilus]
MPRPGPDPVRRLRQETFCDPWACPPVPQYRESGAGRAGGPEELPNLFNPFFTTKKHMVTGLGLSISYALGERHGGRITAESTVGQGAESIVWLREDGSASGTEPDDQLS